MKFSCKLRKVLCWLLDKSPIQILIGFCIFILIAIVICFIGIIGFLSVNYLVVVLPLIKVIAPYIGYIISILLIMFVSYILGEEAAKDLRNKFCIIRR